MKYDVQLIAQTTGMSCWAASIAMILGWRYNTSIADTTIAANSGGTNYTPSMTTGLDPNDRYILERNGFILDEPMCYTPELVKSILEANGPLWVASQVPAGPHIRVVTGYDGKQLYINDPAPVGRGSRYTRSFDRFFGAMEQLGEAELTTQRAPIYVAYLAA
ncbi:MAG: papain-like cysteine protease family protein [Pelagibaca sp.]